MAKRRQRRRDIATSSGRSPGAETSLGAALDLTRLLWAIEHQLNRTSKLLHRRLGITGPQRLVLRIVEEQPGVSAGEIARLIHLDKSTLTGIFRRLEQRRLLVRTTDAFDRRKVRFRARPGATRARLLDAPTLESATAAVVAKTPRESIRAARDVLNAIHSRLESQVSDGAVGRGLAGGPRGRSGSRRASGKR